MTIVEKVVDVRVTKLLRAYKIPGRMGLFTRNSVTRVKPISEYVCEYDRVGPRAMSARWDKGRVRYFFDKLDIGEKLDPIEVVVDDLVGDDVVSVMDGHHRLVAAKLFDAETIAVDYYGPKSVLRQLIDHD